MRSVWIWYMGDYELYHSMVLHTKREAFGTFQPAFYQTAGVYNKINFWKEADIPHDGQVTLYVKGCGCLYIDRVPYPTGAAVPITAGHHVLMASVCCTEAFPAIYVESDVLATDGSWIATPYSGMAGQPNMQTLEEMKRDDSYCFPVGCTPAYTDKNADLTVFPFARTKVAPVSCQTGRIGQLYDFGRETFGTLHFTLTDSESVTVVYGESAEEAQAYGTADKNALPVIWETVTGKGEYVLRSRAFRYISFTGKAENVYATLELPDTPVKADFTADDPLVKRVFDLCTYTFRLCTRECYLDGIKRDRWCWSGDSYVSYLVGDYLYGDPAATRRSLISLFGKPPYAEHICTITDFSSILLIGTAEYVERWGDMAFLRFMWNRIEALYAFILSRLSPEGLMVKRSGDWIFIDWGDMDKEGPFAAEQILLWAAIRAMGRMKVLMGKDGTEEFARADALRATIEKLYYCPEKNAYIDSYTSGRRHISRNTNILALLFDLATGEKAEAICRNVLENDAITPIISPYYSFFELVALCKMGRVERAQERVGSYWGGMLALGATTAWETYDPNEKGTEHLAMYGKAYGRSLCHAWGAGPIYFLGRFVAGVSATSFGSETFEVAPVPGNYKSFRATVPMRDGTVEVCYRDGKVTATTDLSGGTLSFGGKRVPILPGVPTAL